MSLVIVDKDLARHERRTSAIIWLCTAALAIFLIWAHFAILDEVTVGTGKVTPSSRAQVIDSLDGGIVKQLNVHEGDIVEKGQVLATLDPTRFQSNFGEAQAKVRTLRASSERLEAELSGTPLKFSAETLKEPNLVTRERQLYESRRRNLTETISNLQQSLKLVQDELRLTEPLVAKGAAGQVEVIRLRRQVSDLRGEIVPLEDQLLIETRINPRDIAWIRPGLAATVKVTAYDSSIYGDLHGEVETVSPDTLQDEVKRDQYYYRVYVRTQKAELTNRTGRKFPIVPGMVANVEIKTGQKSVMDYLIKPLNKVKESLRER